MTDCSIANLWGGPWVVMGIGGIVVGWWLGHCCNGYRVKIMDTALSISFVFLLSAACIPLGKLPGRGRGDPPPG